MDYHEQPPSEALHGLVKAFWTLDAGGAAGHWIEHQATPDGCMELILRQRGRSRWGAEQPARFAVGLSESAVTFEIDGDSRFAAIRLWPWAWRALGGTAASSLHGRWIEAGSSVLDPLFAVIDQPRDSESTLLAILGANHASLRDTGRAILNSATVGEIGRRTGMAPRRLQRWFADHVGLAPRTYLRLLRFQNAFEGLAAAGALADHAARHGFADQAHMARDFRKLAGGAASRVKARAQGPFLS